MSHPLFHAQDLREHTGGELRIEQELLAEFEKTLERCLTLLDADMPAAEWKATLHELKGAAAAMGAVALREACQLGEADSIDRQHYLYALRRLGRETYEALVAAILPKSPQ